MPRRQEAQAEAEELRQQLEAAQTQGTTAKTNPPAPKKTRSKKKTAAKPEEGGSADDSDPTEL